MKLNMFKSLLSDPLQSIDSYQNYVALLKVLCGKNRSKSSPAIHVLDMIISENVNTAYDQISRFESKQIPLNDNEPRGQIIH